MTMRRGLIMLVAAVIAAAAVGTLGAAGAEKPKKPKKPIGITYQVSTAVQGGEEVVLTKVWIEGDKRRVEENAQVIVKVGDTVTRWQEKGKQAIRLTGVSPYYEISGLALPMHSRAFKQGAKKIGEQTIAGRLCDIYFWTTPMPPPPPGEHGKIPEPENKLWLSKNDKIPMKIVRSNLGPGSNTYVSTAKHIEVGIDIPDSMFQPPKGMKIVDVSTKPPKPRGARR